MQFIPSEQPLPLPSMRLAEASVLKIGAGIDRLSNASKRAAKAAVINFIVSLPKTNLARIHVRQEMPTGPAFAALLPKFVGPAGLTFLGAPASGAGFRVTIAATCLEGGCDAHSGFGDVDHRGGLDGNAGPGPDL
jgi:hypothetical protein